MNIKLQDINEAIEAGGIDRSDYKEYVTYRLKYLQSILTRIQEEKADNSSEQSTGDAYAIGDVLNLLALIEEKL